MLYGETNGISKGYFGSSKCSGVERVPISERSKGMIQRKNLELQRRDL